MALDTRQKRQAAAAIHGAHWFGPGVVPGVRNKAWRQSVGYGYPGIPVGEGAPAAGPVVPVLWHHYQTSRRV